MPEQKKKIHSHVYLIALAITIFIFIAGISFGFFLNKEKITILNENLQDLQIQQQDDEIEFVLAVSKEKACSLILEKLNGTIDLADELGKKVSFYEATERLQDPEYEGLKKQYTLTQIRYWLFLENAKSSCNKPIDTIVYFYSNVECSSCTHQAAVLSYLKQTRPYDVAVFSLDVDTDLDSVRLVKDLFNITEVPTLIVNSRTYDGLQDLDSMNAILNTSM